jgi:hypothetical protein
MMANPRDRVAWLVIPAATVAFQVATASGYGIFRDELYYLACADHPAWGYVDHPPLSIAVLAVFRALFGASLHAIRLAPALAIAAVALLAASIARGLGGGSFAQRIGSLSAATYPLGMSIGGFFSMNAFDILFWTAALRLVVALLGGADPRLWVAFGLVCGLGLQNKVSVLFLGTGLVAGLLLARRFEALRSRWIWIGGAAAAMTFAPHIAWQAAHDWPTAEFVDNARRLKLAATSPWRFVGEQILNASPLALPIWGAGVWALLRSEAMRPWRAIGWAYLVILIVMIVQGAKPYYLGPVYPALFAAGGVAWERGTVRRPWLRPVAVAAVVVGAVALAPFTKGLLPVETFVAYARALHIMPRSGERQDLGRLPQHFADMHGWQALAEQVGHVRDGLPQDEKAAVCVFGQNYGEAGAIDRFGPSLGLPRAVSGHNAYWMWGPPPGCQDATWIVIGDDRETLETIFESVTLAARFDCDLCMPYEDDNPIWVCRRLKMPLEALWPQVKKYV